MNFKFKYLIKKVLIHSLFNKYVVYNPVIQEDIDRTLQIRGSKLVSAPLRNKFNHLMQYYPEFALIFFWRIKKRSSSWRRLFTKDFHCKIFGSTEIAGGLMCYHPFATVINAKSIGKNFQFRNGLTIGNKSNDNSQLPIIGNDVTVGSNVVIIGNITIGDHVIIGAGSVVVKDVKSHSVVAGNPAKVIRTLLDEKTN